MAELESEGTKTRGGVADFLREFADELDQADRRLAEGGRTRAASEERQTAGTADETDHEAAEADHPEDANRITLLVGGDSATVVVPEEVEFDVEVDSRSPMLGSGVRQEIDFRLSWDVSDPEATTDEMIQIR
jgi:hypothetical protein